MFKSRYVPNEILEKAIRQMEKSGCHVINARGIEFSNGEPGVEIEWKYYAHSVVELPKTTTLAIDEIDD